MIVAAVFSTQEGGLEFVYEDTWCNSGDLDADTYGDDEGTRALMRAQR